MSRWAAVVALALAGCPAQNQQTQQDLSVIDNDLATAPDLSEVAADLAEPTDLSGDLAMSLSCTAGKFLRCSGTMAIFCAAGGNAEESIDCGGPCVGSTDLGVHGCGQCDSDTCGAFLVTCDEEKGKIVQSSSCRTLRANSSNLSVCKSATECQQCERGGVGGSILTVCGDGISHGTAAHTQYDCSAAGVLGAATPCPFGCDSVTGECGRLWPANDALNHIQGITGTFCNGAASTLPVIEGLNAGVTYTFDTTAQELHVDPSPSPNPVFGVHWTVAPYTPPGSNSTAVVAHVRRVNLSGGAKLKVVGANMLILLVDETVTLMGGTDGMPTLVDAVGVATGSGGPGAKAAQANTTQAVSNGGGGAGGGHATAGGNGGNGSGDIPDSSGASGGAAYGALGVLTPGSHGGNGALWGSGAGDPGTGGGGGGALQISACGSITVGAGVLINASGGGGGGGGGANAPQNSVTDYGGGGGGGGSGGGIILEGATVSVAGRIVANGGGGGEGGSNVATDESGDAADSWGYSTTGTFNPVATPDYSNWTVDGRNASAAGVPGGVASPDGTNNDGARGATAGLTTPGGGGNASFRFGGGGGGGAMGRISFHIGAAATKPTVPAASTSPAPTMTRACRSGTPCSYTLIP